MKWRGKKEEIKLERGRKYGKREPKGGKKRGQNSEGERNKNKEREK